MDNSELKIILADSITHVQEETRSHQIVICGSHGGWVAGVFALKKNIKGAIFNDAGIGKEKAGVAGLLLLEKYDIPGAAVNTFTAMIGNAKETENGIISFVNYPGSKMGIRIGMTGHEASIIMKNPSVFENKKADFKNMDIEEKIFVIHSAKNGCRIITMDSNSMITNENQRDIILTGSHGGIVGSAPAVKYPVMAAFYNDAGVGKEQAGIKRLEWLEKRGIIGGTVDANTAKIGLGIETYECGILSHVNPVGIKKGLRPGMRAADAAFLLLRESSFI